MCGEKRPTERLASVPDEILNHIPRIGRCLAEQIDAAGLC
jgi:hypothetical protein